MNFKKYLLGVAFVSISALGLAGCGGSNTAATTNVWRVGTDASYAPFGFQDESHKSTSASILTSSARLQRSRGARLRLKISTLMG